MTAVIGWVSACVLVATISVQIIRQYRERSVHGVSPWLYVGQGLASSGLLAYSALSRQWVFVAINAAMTIAAVIGLALWFHVRRLERGRGEHGSRAPRVERLGQV